MSATDNASGVWGRSSEIGHRRLLLLPFDITDGESAQKFWRAADDLASLGVLSKQIDMYTKEELVNWCLLTTDPEPDEPHFAFIQQWFSDNKGKQYYSLTKFSHAGYRHMWSGVALAGASRDRWLMSIVDCQRATARKHALWLHDVGTDMNFAVLGG